jgi:hypothetical protein
MGNRSLTSSQNSLIQKVMKGQATQTKWNSYYSRVRVGGAASGTNITTLAAGQYTIQPAAPLRAFSYGRGQDMASAGIPGVLATAADTNITTANQTVAGEVLVIEGIGLILLGQSDAGLAKQLDQNLSVIIKLNSSTEYLLGVPSMVPGPGGLYGVSDAPSVGAGTLEQFAMIGAMSNGIPSASNFMPLPEPMVWLPAGQGDSNFNVNLNVERATSTLLGYAHATRVEIASIATISPVAPYAAPLGTAVFVDYMVVLIGQTANPLSQN